MELSHNQCHCTLVMLMQYSQQNGSDVQQLNSLLLPKAPCNIQLHLFLFAKLLRLLFLKRDLLKELQRTRAEKNMLSSNL